LTFYPGETVKTISVTVYGDTLTEPEAIPPGGFGGESLMGEGFGDSPSGLGEEFFLNLSNATNATIIDAQGLGFIEDDD
jgi:hypothetical protein